MSGGELVGESSLISDCKSVGLGGGVGGGAGTAVETTCGILGSVGPTVVEFGSRILIGCLRSSTVGDSTSNFFTINFNVLFKLFLIEVPVYSS